MFDCSCSSPSAIVLVPVFEYSSVGDCSSARVFECSSCSSVGAQVLSCSRALVLPCSCSSARVLECSSARHARVLMLTCSSCSTAQVTWMRARAFFMVIYIHIYIGERCLHFRFKKSICSCTKKEIPIVSSVHDNSTVHGYITYEHARKLDCQCHIDARARLFRGRTYVYTSI